MEFLKAENVVKQYANHLALNDVSISVPKGSVYGLLGPNGAGKTTLIRIINQITGPDKGAVFFDGAPIKRKDVERIGYLPEERGLYKKMKVGDQALYLAKLKGISASTAEKRLKEWFKKFKITEWWDKKVEELSKGMQQKIQFITTVIHEPELLIFDEPFSGFDPINANLLKEEILKLKDNGATIIFSTHNMASVEEVCDNIALINKSKKLLEGPIQKIKDEFNTNTFEVLYNGDNSKLESSLGSNYSLVENTAVNSHYKALIKCNAEKNPNDLLSTLLPNVEINSFKELLPSMNDIFIRVVEENITIG